MIGSRLPSPLTLGVAVLVGVIVTSGVVWALSAAAKPRDYRQRIAAVEAALDEIERVGPQKPSPYGEATLCKGAALNAAGALRTRLLRQTAETGLTVKQLTVAAGGGGYRQLAALEVTYTAEGGYADVRRMMALLGAGAPEVFIDAFEIKPAGGKTALKIRGRAFCWISARP